MVYSYLDFILTLGCNGGCRNCIKFCGMDEVTGLDYSDTDVTMDQVVKFVEQVEALAKRKSKKTPPIELPVIKYLTLTGGEPLLHPQIKEITKLIVTRLQDSGLVEKVQINSNLVIKAPRELAPYIINYSTIPDKKNVHNVVLLHPSDMNKPGMTYAKCNHYRRDRVVLTCYGYSMCCAADGYIRLFGLDDLVIPALPDSPEGFPLDQMDQVCRHCPFPYMNDHSFLEKNLGRPVSEIYKEQADLNRAGRSLTKKF